MSIHLLNKLITLEFSQKVLPAIYSFESHPYVLSVSHIEFMFFPSYRIVPCGLSIRIIAPSSVASRYVIVVKGAVLIEFVLIVFFLFG